ncbi:hypothetical protein LUZ60_009459 [Juncus effusus]|nr:hypothetical protein LUZ60_009459 [Juncus effusus]
MAGELNLDAFLSSSDDDVSPRDHSVSFRPRTVDEILNSSSSSSSDSEPESAFLPKRESEIKTFPSSSSQPESITRSASLDLLPPSSKPLSSLALRGGYNTNRSAGLFRGVRVSNPKPGAALAAATAASRSVKLRRVDLFSRSSPKVSSEELDVSEAVEEEVKKVVDSSSSADLEEFSGNLQAEEKEEERDGGSVELEIGGETVELSSGSLGNVLEVEGENATSLGESVSGTNMCESASGNNLDENVVLETVEVDPDVLKEEQETKEEDTEEAISNSESIEQLGTNNGEQNTDKMDNEDQITQNSDQIEIPKSPESENPESSNQTNQQIEEAIHHAVELAKKAEKKLKSQTKPLEYFEEIEKRQASYGLHHEECSVAQPMRLEGIRRGPPAVGYLQIDLDNVITRVVSSQGFRKEHGRPQVVAVNKSYVAFGMSKGSVFVVNSKYSVHSSDTMDPKMLVFANQLQGSVTSMCFSPHGEFLLVGYGDGHLTIWDVARSAPAKVVEREHSAPVVHAFFLGQDLSLSRQYKAITADSKGLVLLHTFSVVPLLNRFSIKTQCLLDGKMNGTVLSASPLLVEETHNRSGAGTSAQGAHASVTAGGLSSMVGGVMGGSLFNEGAASSLEEDGVVIFVTHQNALVVKLGNGVEVYEKFSRPEGVREGSMPYTAWKCVPVSHDSEESERISWLAIAWDRSVQIYKLIKSEMKMHREWSLDCAAIGVAWLDDQMLVVLNTRGQLCLFAKDGSELHRTSITTTDDDSIDDIITFHTHFSNVYGNPEKSYHNSVSVRGATVYILGPMHLMVSRLLPWKERIQVLQRAGDWMGALDMAMRIYDGHTQGVVDLPRKIGDIREAIMPFLVELLLSYVDEVFSYISVAFRGQSGKEAEMEEQYARVGGVAVEYCVHISRTDILFDTVFSRFLAVQHGGTFLEILEPYILKDMLGCLLPEIMQALVEHYSEKGWLQRVEQCILHMDISSLDFNQVVRLCREHGLYGALIYLFNQGLNDYRVPLEELLTVVQNSSDKKEASRTCYRMLVYLKYCFQGLAFPPGHGRIPYDRVQSVRIEILQFLLEESKSQNSQISQTFRASCNTCPNLSHLLVTDTEATLEVLKFALTDLESTVQDLTNTLVQILGLENETLISFQFEESGVNWPVKKDLGHLLNFLSFVVSQKGARVSARVLKHVLVYLTSSEKGTDIEKEKEVLGLLRVLEETKWNSDDVLDLCLNAGFHQACGWIHETRGHNILAMDSYMKDKEDPLHAFAFIDKILSGQVSTNKEATSFRSAVVSRIPDLVKLNRECTFVLIMDHFNAESNEILSGLSEFPESLFLFLKTGMEVHLSGNLNFGEFRVLKDDKAVEGYLERVTSLQKIGFGKNPIHVTDEIAEHYLELLCRYESNSVLKFLQTFDNYRLEHCLSLCLVNNVTDGAAFLLERAGDVSGALVLVMKDLSEKFDYLVSSLKRDFGDSEDLDAILKMNEALVVLDVLRSSIGLCQRNTHRIDQTESESLWFCLFDAFSEPLRRFPGGKGKSILRRVFSQFVGEIIEGMARYVPLPAITAKLLSDSGNQEFGDFKLIILKMLGTYGYEKRILDTAKSVIEDDTFYTLSLLKKGVSHAFSPQNLSCCICNSPLHKTSSNPNPKIRLYTCGHATHLTCESQQEEEKKVRLKGEIQHTCPVCLPKSSRNKSSSGESGLIGFYVQNGKQPQGATGGQMVEGFERSRASQVSRFEILNNLQKSRKPFQTDPLPQLRLSPPVIYHEPVKRGTVLRGETSNNGTVKTDKSKRIWQIKDLRSKGFKSNLFGPEKSKLR